MRTPEVVPASSVPGEEEAAEDVEETRILGRFREDGEEVGPGGIGRIGREERVVAIIGGEVEEELREDFEDMDFDDSTYFFSSF